jgi:hypothetical protein
MLLFGLGRKPSPPPLKTKLPAVNSFVALAMTDGGPRGSVCVETIGQRSLTVSALRGVKVGGTGVFSYENNSGRFRFSARCLDVRSPPFVSTRPFPRNGASRPAAEARASGPGRR